MINPPEKSKSHVDISTAGFFCFMMLDVDDRRRRALFAYLEIKKVAISFVIIFSSFSHGREIMNEVSFFIFLLFLIIFSRSCYYDEVL